MKNMSEVIAEIAVDWAELKIKYDALEDENTELKNILSAINKWLLTRASLIGSKGIVEFDWRDTDFWLDILHPFYKADLPDFISYVNQRRSAKAQTKRVNL